MTYHGCPNECNAVPGEGHQQGKVQEALSVLREYADENAAFLWTGGKEANVVADMLLYAVGSSPGDAPVPFVTIDTGNGMPSIEKYREKYVASEGDKGAATIGPETGIQDHYTIRYEEMLQNVIYNTNDPRGYHGTWDEIAGDVPDHDGELSALPETREEWDVPASCGALKVVPLRRLITGETDFGPDDGFDYLITGQRGDDPLSPGEDGALDTVVKKSSPARHTRVNPLADWTERNVYAYLKKESVALPLAYTEAGYRHTDASCCVDEETDIGEYGEGGRDPEKEEARDRLQKMGYV